MKYLVLIVAAGVLAVCAGSASASVGGPDVPACDGGPCVGDGTCGYNDPPPPSFDPSQSLAGCVEEYTEPTYYLDAKHHPCQGHYEKYVGHGPFGNTLFKYRQLVSFCYNGSKITTTYRERGPYGQPWYGSLWHFDGNIFSNCTSEPCYEKAGGSSATIKTQGSFSTPCVTVFGVPVYCQSADPVIVQRMTATGGYSHDHYLG